MPRTLQEILAPKTVLKAISQLDLPGATLQRLFGWGLGGENRLRTSGRRFSYDTFDTSRKIATGRVPGQAASRQAPHRVGRVQGTFPRAAEVIPLLDEELLNQRAIGGPAGELDSGGRGYITRQEAYLAQRFANLLEFQTAAMLRGAYSYHQQGDELRHGFGGGPVTIDFQIPAGNLGQLDMLGDGPILEDPWSDDETDIPAQLHAVNAALVTLTGMGLAHVVLTGAGWQHVVHNKQVQAQGGSANVIVESMRRIGAGEFQAVLRALPWITFHIVDYGLEVFDGEAETFTRLIEDDHAAFFPEPSPRWTQYLEGSEIVTEGPGGPRAERFGFYPYAYPVHDPSGWELAAVHNGIPALYTPAALAYGRITQAEE